MKKGHSRKDLVSLLEESENLEKDEREIIEELVSILEKKKAILKDLLEANTTALEDEETLREYEEDHAFNQEAMERVEAVHEDIEHMDSDLSSYEEQHSEERELLERLQEEENTVDKIQRRLENLIEENS
jgi:hypothetical protein